MASYLMETIVGKAMGVLLCAIDEKGYTLTGLVCDVDGSHQVKQSKSGPEAQSEKIGLQLAEALLALGAGEILERLNANAR